MASAAKVFLSMLKKLVLKESPVQILFVVGAMPFGTRPAGIDLANLALSAGQLSFTFKGDSLDQKGIVQVSATVSQDAWLCTGVRPDGTTFPVTATRTAAYSRDEEKARGR